MASSKEGKINLVSHFNSGYVQSMAHTLRELGVLPELKSFNIFSSYDNEYLEELCLGGTVSVSQHREPLFDMGDRADFFYIVLSGAYKLAKPTITGEDSIIHFSPPGDVIAAFILSQPNPQYPVSAISMGPSRALKIPRQNYLEVWKPNSDLIFAIQNLFSSRMAALQQQKVMGKAPLQSKVATLLLHLLDQQQAGENNQMIAIPLTRKEIADSVGASVESVIRVMSEWSKKGFILTNNQKITLVKPEKLIELINI